MELIEIKERLSGQKDGLKKAVEEIIVLLHDRLNGVK